MHIYGASISFEADQPKALQSSLPSYLVDHIISSQMTVVNKKERPQSSTDHRSVIKENFNECGAIGEVGFTLTFQLVMAMLLLAKSTCIIEISRKKQTAESAN